MRGLNRRANSALERTIRPCLSTVAIAIGVFWKKRMKRTSAARCGSVPSSRGAVEHERARGAGRAVGAERDLVEQPHRHGAAAAGLEVDVEHLGLDVARRGRERGQQRRAVAGDDVGELETAGADLRQIVIEPVGERGVEIDDVAVRHRPRRSRPARGRDSRSRAAAPGTRSPGARARASRRRATRRSCAASRLPSPSGRTRRRSQRAASPPVRADAHLLLQRGGLRAPP